MLRGLIILDGPDCSGKSTLATAIKKRVEAHGAEAVIHHSIPIEGSDCWEVHSKELLAYIHEAFIRNKVVIMDRLFMSEAVYGAVYRGGSVYPYAVRHIDRLLHRFRALRVVCAPPVNVVIEQHSKAKKLREEMYEDISEVATRYRLLWTGLDPKEYDGWHLDAKKDYVQWLTLTGGVQDRPGWYHYDFSRDGDLECKHYVEYLINELVEEQKSSKRFTLDPVGLTHTGFANTGSVLLVGDKLAGPNRLSLPFYANSGSSLYLAKTLHSLQIEENKLTICNINDPSGLEQTQELIEEIDFSRVIALGRLAERALLQNCIKFDAAVRHPQHARRFSYNDNSYETELRQALS